MKLISCLMLPLCFVMALTSEGDLTIALWSYAAGTWTMTFMKYFGMEGL